MTAVFVVVTGIVGAILGEVLLAWCPIYSPLARGALLGVGAYGADTNLLCSSSMTTSRFVRDYLTSCARSAFACRPSNRVKPSRTASALMLLVVSSSTSDYQDGVVWNFNRF